jgi:hypothetical protein
MDYKKLNNYTGWLVLIFATTVYFMTLEPTTSLWDCGEYITTAYKLEVGHPPGAPLFMMLGRIFTMFTSAANAAMMINGMSALCSAFTILFLYWTITLIAKKIVSRPEPKLFGSSSIDDLAVDDQKSKALSDGHKWAIIGSGLIGALAYTFTDSFWFSAVEGEVYAMSSFFTAIVFWAILKWDAECQEKIDFPEDETIQGKHEDRWLIFIFFMIGLSIGVHLLNLLCIPIIAYVIYFRKVKETTVGGFILTGIIGIAALGVIQALIIPKTVQIAGFFERFFVNDMGMAFNSGTVFFFLMLISIITVLLWYSKKSGKTLMNTITWSASMIFIGYSCFAMIVIRSNANTPLDENDPENLVSLQAYLQREQYGDWPILYGQYFTAELEKDRKKWDDRSDTYLRRFVVSTSKGDELKGFKKIEEANAFSLETPGSSITEKYFKTFDGTGARPTYDPAHSTFFPRMYSSEQRHINGYKKWSGHTGTDAPTMVENIKYFGGYQVGFMYWRYFMWNFSGRQSDEQGDGNPRDGNWISGLNFIDQHHVGDQTLAPGSITTNPSHNKFYMLPLILGLIGFIFLLSKGTKAWWTVMLFFLLTGFAIIIYLNQKPMEPRERDYAYAASFYAFSIYIGMSVLALFDAYKNMVWKDLGILVGVLFGISLFFFITNTTAAMSMLFITFVIGLLYSIMVGIKKVMQKESSAGILAILMLLPVPIIMGMQGWDDHDRSGRYTAQALAYNYLQSCDDNAIVYTNGDNDTFPLWYLQEVENVKTSVRVCNLSLLNTDWYTEQMTKKAYDSEPLPISFTEEQYRQNGSRDYMYVLGTNELTMNSPQLEERWKSMLDIKISSNPTLFKPAFETACTNLHLLLSTSSFPTDQQELYESLPTFDSTNTYFQFRSLVFNILSSSDAVTGKNKWGVDETTLQSIQNVLITFNNAFDYMPAKAAMAYLANDANKEDRGLFILPSKGLTIDVDKEKVVANGTVDARYADRIVDRLEFRIPKQTIFKADLMVLDIAAHFDWDRPLYFASSAGASTYMGLDKYFFAEGLVYKLMPVLADRNRNPNSLGEVNKAKMFKNLVHDFKWGNMEDEDVLVDYYTRRLTNNYRVQFSVLADAYVEEIESAKQRIQVLQQIQSSDTPEDQIIKTPIGDFKKSDVPLEVAKAQMIIDSNSVKVNQVLDRSFEVMPEYNVPFGRVVPSYISSYYGAGNYEKAEFYTNRMLAIYQEEVDYYLSVGAKKSSNMIDFIFDSFRGVYSVWQSAQMLSDSDDFKEQTTTALFNMSDQIQMKLNEIKKEASPSQKARINETIAALINQVDVIKSQLTLPS